MSPVLEGPQPLEQLTNQDGRLADLVDRFATATDLPPTRWLTQLRLERPRVSVRCLGERTRYWKRVTDIVVSASMLVLLVPVLLMVALLVRLTSPGPVIFRQVRTGLNLRGTRRDRRSRRNATPTGSAAPASDKTQDLREPGIDRRQRMAYGKPFVLYKFRTMRVDAERLGAQFAQKGDPRVTPVGLFLRRTRLDELPQLWNVLRGDMSLVGPRPERPEFIAQLSDEIPDYLQRLGLRPGLTGLAQILNGYDNDVAGFRRKVALDLLYLQNCCVINDAKILLRTVGVVLTGKGAL